MRKICCAALALSLILGAAAVSNAQETPGDSLIQALNNTPKGTEKIDLLDELTQHFLNKANLEQAEHYLEQEWTESVEMDYHLGQGRVYRTKARIAKTQGDWETSRLYGDSALAIGAAYNLPELQASASISKGIWFIHFAELDSAERYINQALVVAKNMASDRWQSVALMNLSRIANSREEFERSLAYAFNALALFDKTGSVRNQALAQEMMGMNYTALREFEKAHTALERSRKIYEQLDYPGDIARLSLNIGSVYKKQEDYPEALKWMNKGLRIMEELGTPAAHLAGFYFNIGELYSHIWEHEKAKAYINKALEASLQSGEKMLEALCRIKLADVYFNTGFISKSLEMGIAAREASVAANCKECLQKSALILSEIHKEMGNYDLALADYVEYKRWGDSIAAQSNLAAIQAMHDEFEAGLLKSEVALARKENEVQEIAIKQQNTWLVATGSVVLLLLLLTALMFLRVREKQRSLVQLEQAKGQLQDRNGELQGLLNQKESAVVSVDDYFWIKEKNRRWVKLIIDDIVYIEAQNNNVDIVTTDKVYREIGVNLLSFTRQVSNTSLIRTHRSFLVNVDHLKMMEDNMLFLSTGRVPIGESFRKTLFKQLHFLRTSRAETVPSA